MFGTCTYVSGLPSGSDGKESAYNAGDPGSIPGPEDPLEKGMATHFSILAWRIHGQRNLAGCSPWGCKESDTTEQLTGPRLYMHTHTLICGWKSFLEIRGIREEMA